MNWGCLGNSNIVKYKVKNAVIFKCISNNITESNAILIDPSIDSVYISLPHAIQFEWICKTLDNNKNILCEKPAILTKEQLKILKEKIKNNNKIFNVVNLIKGNNAFNIIKNTDIGLNFIDIIFSYTNNDPTNFRNKKIGGGVIYDFMKYILDIGDYFCGDIIILNTIKNKSTKFPIINLFSGSIKYNNINITFNCTQQGINKQQFSFYGSNGSIILDSFIDYDHLIINEKKLFIEYINPYKACFDDFSIDKNLFKKLEYMCNEF